MQASPRRSRARNEPGPWTLKTVRTLKIMIHANDIQRVSEAVQSRAVGGKVWRMSDTEFRFHPADKSKAIRIINFLSDGKVLCVDAKTGESCPAGQYGLCCYHIYRVVLFVTRSAARRRRAA